MQQIIEELKHTACLIDSEKQGKTIETLNAISGMLESLKNNHIFSPVKQKRTYESKSPPTKESTTDMELKVKFEGLIYSLQNEFNSMLDARKIIKEQHERLRRETKKWLILTLTLTQ